MTTWHRLLIALVVGCGSLLAATSSAWPCGMSTHGEVCVRAVHYFASGEYPAYEQYLDANPQAYQAGAAFPDWGYAFGYHDESEVAHWAPYLTAFAAHVHEKYPKPWNAEVKRIAAFLLGAVAHSIADIWWHNMAGVQEGFLEAMAQQDFHGDFDAALAAVGGVNASWTAAYGQSQASSFGPTFGVSAWTWYRSVGLNFRVERTSELVAHSRVFSDPERRVTAMDLVNVTGDGTSTTVHVGASTRF